VETGTALPIHGGGRHNAPRRQDHWPPAEHAVTIMASGEIDESEVLSELDRLRQEHRDLDAAIDALARMQVADRLQIQRLKKRKLVLRDRIAYLEDLLTPDIIA